MNDEIKKISDKIKSILKDIPDNVLTIGGIVIAVLVLGYVGFKLYKKFTQDNGEELEEQIEQFKLELQARYGSSKYAKSVIELELTAFRKAALLKAYHAEAIELNETEKARLIEEQIQQIDILQKELRESALRHEEAEARLRSAVAILHPPLGKKAMRLLTGQILLIRHVGKYSAIQAIDQASGDRGGFIRYFWWYQPDGTGVFTTDTATTGFGETGEGKGNQLEIGPFKLSWSKSDDGAGWVYFGPTVVPSPDFELAYTSETDISKIDAATYVFLKPNVDEDDEEEEED